MITQPHFQDDPEEVAIPQVESVRSSDIDFIDTEEEDSVGPRGSMDDFDGSENSEVKKTIFLKSLICLSILSINTCLLVQISMNSQGISS